MQSFRLVQNRVYTAKQNTTAAAIFKSLEAMLSYPVNLILGMIAIKITVCSVFTEDPVVEVRLVLNCFAKLHVSVARGLFYPANLILGMIAIKITVCSVFTVDPVVEVSLVLHCFAKLHVSVTRGLF